jgi:hypothetical protein
MYYQVCDRETLPGFDDTGRSGMETFSRVEVVTLSEARLEGWPNSAARLAGWMRVTGQV